MQHSSWLNIKKMEVLVTGFNETGTMTINDSNLREQSTVKYVRSVLASNSIY